MVVPNTPDPETEFIDDVETPETPVVTKPAGPPAASAEELAALKQQFEGLRNDAQLVHRLKELFSEQPSDPRDKLIRKEIQRLVPELDDVDKIKRLLPAIVESLAASTEDRVQSRATEADTIMRGLMEGLGLDAADDEAAGYLEETITREIRANPELLKDWSRGNVKRAVTKAFDKVQTKLFAPVRAKSKAGAVKTITESPRATPRGGTPSAPASKLAALDLKDTSREGVQKVHDAAWTRLQELIDQG